MSFNSKYTGAQVEAWLDNIKNYSANDILEKVKTVDGSGSGLDADLLDGVHLMGKGGTHGIMRSWARGTYTTSKQYFGNGNVVVIDPKPTDDSSLWANTTIFSVGDTEIRSHQLAFGYDEDRILYRRVDDGPRYNSWRTIAFTDSNVASATKLQTARTIWGQSFDGTGNVSGDMSNVGTINSFIKPTLSLSTVAYLHITTLYSDPYDGVHMYVADKDNSNNLRPLILQNGYGNVGIGTASPAYKLHVNGDIHANGSITQNSDINLKNISKDILISLDDIAEAPLFEFTYKSDKDKRIHVGTSAQYWVEKNNWFCKKQDNGYYDMEIQNLSLASAISIAKEFKKYKEETDSTISNMKNEIKELKQIVLNMNK